MSETINSDAAVPLTAHPPISLDRFIEQSGLSPATVWRYRKKGWLRTINIAGRHYVTREEIAAFNRRATSGEFAGKVQQPGESKRASSGESDSL